MTVKLLTEHHLDFLSLIEALKEQALLSLFISKYHIARNLMSRLNNYQTISTWGAMGGNISAGTAWVSWLSTLHVPTNV